jgi:hypothetical protein
VAEWVGGGEGKKERNVFISWYERQKGKNHVEDLIDLDLVIM